MKTKGVILFACILLAVFFILQYGCSKEENKNPTCNITSPNTGEVLVNGTSVTIMVNAEDSDGEINIIRYYIDGVKIGSSSSIPYKYEWNTFDHSIGHHIIKAAAEDNESGTKSDEISISIINNSCPGIPTITYEGQVYNTVQIGDQCWMEENLNVGTMILGDQEMEDNSVIEKYCLDNNETNCNNYGGLYQWDEMMQYSTTPGIQGICPTGWHLPTDAEWCTLTQFIDSNVNCNVVAEWSGTSAGYKMKSNSGWNNGSTGLNGNGLNSSGFNALPSGEASGNFYGFGYGTFFWSSNEDVNYAWLRYLRSEQNNVMRTKNYKGDGKSVRCIKD